MKKKKIKVVELFAGVGGFRLGLEEASNCFEVVWANQWEPSMGEQFAYECYVSHFGESMDYICQDIASVKSQVPNHDLLVGGFPCQDYSIMKKNSKGIEGSKGVLWWQINDIIELTHPKYILLENVDRILLSPSKQKGRDFSIILRCLYEKGYSVEWRVINAADYGQSQRRRRTFIFAFHKETESYIQYADNVCKFGLKAMHEFVMIKGIFAKSFPIVTHSRDYTDTWIDEIVYSDIPSLSHRHSVNFFNSGSMINGRVYSVDTFPKIEPYIAMENILENIEIDSHYFLRFDDIEKWKYAKGSKCELRVRRDGSKYYFTEGNVEFPDSLKKPARTILTSEGTVGRASHVVIDKVTGKLRILTPIECERLNGFPDNWTNTGMPERMRYFCMGNALVVPIVTRIGRELANLF